MGAELKKEIIDQAAHFVAGVVGVLLINMLSGGVLWLVVLMALMW